MKNKRQERIKVGLPVPCEPDDGSICGAISVSVCQSNHKSCRALARVHVSNWSTEGEDGDDALEQRETQQ